MNKYDPVPFGSLEAELLADDIFSAEPIAVAPTLKAELMQRLENDDRNTVATDGAAAAVPDVVADADAVPDDAATVVDAEVTPPAGGGNVTDISEYRNRRLSRAFTAVAASLLLVVGGFGGGRYVTMNDMADTEVFAAIHEASDYTQTTYTTEDGHTIRLVWSYEAHAAALVMPADMDMPDDMMVKAWLVKGQEMNSIGEYSGQKGNFTMLTDMPDRGDSVMLTVEKKDGSEENMLADIPMK
ncbi:anti-sigma factor domain-containing protein [Corynebacterium caspium]|uniref:anti-sigma factor domain-containing protein n=1 Tax=Corynebacterium caspium TaxID=234828 RepID=UPI000363A28F|nr:anti-sigma factor [Corynebacterium caspium]WKD58597.1 Anti-sigma-K factor rskA [Corynebacterium caspium DSM 44850]